MDKKRGEDNRVEELKRKIDDLQKRIPIHSVSASMIQELEDLEEDLENKLKKLNKK